MHERHKAIDKEKILDYEKPRRVALVCSRGVKDGKVTSGKEHKQREADERIPNSPQRLRNAREQTACSGGGRPRKPCGVLEPLGRQHRLRGRSTDRRRRRRPHGATQIVCRARRPSQRFRTRKTLGRVERHRHADGIGKWGGNATRLALLAHVEPWFRVDSSQAEEQQGAKCVDVAAHTRLPKPILLGRRIGSRAKLDGVGIGAIAPYAGDPQVDNHQRRKRQTVIRRIVGTCHDDIRRLEVTMDHRRRRLPRHCKTGVELAHGIA